MKTALFYGPEDVRIEEVEIPKPGYGEIVVKNRVALTCGTDVKTYLRGYPLWKPPYPFGHEAAGEVAYVGEGVNGFKVGDRVVAHNSAPCNRCYFCKHGQHSLCENIKFNLGAFSEYQRIPQEIVDQNTFKLPEGLSFKDAALMEPFSCAVYGIEEADIHPGEVVVINGAGPIGLMFTKLAHLKGAKVITVDLHDERLKKAEKLGADIVLNASKLNDQIEAVKKVTENQRGVDVAIEAVGLPETWQKTIMMARKGGKVLLFGGAKAGTTVSIDTRVIHYSQLTIKGVFHTTPKHVMVAFELLKRKVISSEDFVENEYDIRDIKKALIEHKEGRVIKNCIVFDLVSGTHY
ncbi:zinc-binding dehydrogenase [Thermoanaerobacterium sp. DL9XJH110]|uniref:zinc-binding dehydrogenase n=1 Tax=Thermoanaerobacterium sp. DL9XJH110 TaxID=3386643 RepID=UPI003BB51419